MKEKKKVMGIVLVAVLCVIGLSVVLIGNNQREDVKIDESITPDNFEVVQEDGTFYLNGGYIILKTEDECDFLDRMSSDTYFIQEVVQDNTNETGYKFVAGKYENIKYGTTEEEILKTLEKEFEKTPEKKSQYKSKSGAWQHVRINDAEDKDSDASTVMVDVYYQLTERLLYMVYMYTDEESVKPEKLLDDLYLQESAVIDRKNENPLKEADDGSFYYEKLGETDEMKCHFPKEYKDYIGSLDDTKGVNFNLPDGSYLVAKAVKEDQKVEGHYASVREGDIDEDAVQYQTLTTEDRTTIECEQFHERQDGIDTYYAFVQIECEKGYYILDMIIPETIEDIEAFCEGFYIS